MFKLFLAACTVAMTAFIIPRTSAPTASIHTFKVEALDGSVIDFSKYKGKKILVVNTASKCGYTPQYEFLQKLYMNYSDKLIIVGFPANNFGQQEPGNNIEIKEFCTKNYGATFPMAARPRMAADAKSRVPFQLRGDGRRKRGSTGISPRNSTGNHSSTTAASLKIAPRTAMPPSTITRLRSLKRATTAQRMSAVSGFKGKSRNDRKKMGRGEMNAAPCARTTVRVFHFTVSRLLTELVPSRCGCYDPSRRRPAPLPRPTDACTS